MQLFPRPPFFRQNANANQVFLETEGEETISIVRATSLHPIEIGEELHFSGNVTEFGEILSIYHGDALVGTVDSIGPFTRDHLAVSTSSHLEYRAEGEGQLIVMSWPSVTK